MASKGGDRKHGVPTDPKARDKVRAGLNDDEKKELRRSRKADRRRRQAEQEAE
jgi:hypothetical protein